MTGNYLFRSWKAARCTRLFFRRRRTEDGAALHHAGGSCFWTPSCGISLDTSRTSTVNAQDHGYGRMQNGFEMDQNTENPEQIKRQILTAALNKVPQYGWTEDALVAGAAECQLPSVTHGLFGRGGADLVIYFYTENNTKFAATFPPRDTKDNSADALKRYFSEAVRIRLLMNTSQLEWWASALGILAQPKYARKGIQLVGQLTDDMWYLSGDHAVDANWYAKRAALATIYNATELYMLQDKSEGFCDTWEFLDRWLSVFIRMHNEIIKVQEPLSYTLPFLDAAVTTIANLTGLNQRRHF